MSHNGSKLKRVNTRSQDLIVGGYASYESRSPTQTFEFGYELGKRLKPNSIIALFGELGAGKTTLIKGIAHGSTGILPEMVSSPTFTYMNIYGYDSAKPLFHFDLYRLNDGSEFFSLGFEEYFYSNGLCCIEWSERIESYLPQEVVKLFLSHDSNTEEHVTSRLISYEIPESQIR